MKKVLGIAAALAMVAFATTKAQATPIGQFTSTDGLIFTLSADGASATDLSTADGVNDTQQFTLSLDSSGYSNIGATPSDVFSSLSLKLVSGAYDAEQLTASPSGSWSDMGGGLNNGGCDGSGTGFFCTDIRSGGVFTPTGGVALDGSTYTWTWLVDPGTGGFDLPGHIKAQWFTSGGDKIQQISEDFTACTGETDCGGELPPPVPEPTTLLLLSSGLAGAVGSKLRRRRSL